MIKHNFFPKLVNVGVASLGAVAFAGMTTSPAQAGQLSWEDGSSSFIESFSDATNPPDTFSVTFSPDETESPDGNGIGAAAISTANGEFDGPFNPAPPLFLTDLIPATANFNIADDGDTPSIIEYTLGNNLVFDFRDENTQITIDTGSLFGVELTTDAGNFEGIEVELLATAGNDNVVIDGELFPCCSIPDGNSLDGISLSFDQPAGGTASEYSAGAVVSRHAVPEPTTILGLITISGLGLSLKRRKQVS